MRILIAPDSFKESCSARAAAEAIARGVRRALPAAELDLCPIADGGEGTVEALLLGAEAERHETEVRGPLGELPRPRAVWGWIAGRRTAVAEMAAAAGLPLVPPERRDPTRTSTYGVGEMVAAIRDFIVAQGAADDAEILLGLGGSATVDGGAGMAQALGVRLIDCEGREISEPVAGGDFIRVARAEVGPFRERWPEGVRLAALVDVDNPLLGPRGAARVFGPQKGATRAQVAELESGLAHWARVIKNSTGRGVADLPGAGAAGGLAAGIAGLLGGEIRAGSEAIFQALEVERRLEAADAVVTGEGSFDTQSLGGKGPGSLVRRAIRAGKTAVVIAGQVRMPPGELHALGLRRVYSLMDRARSLEESVARAPELLEEAGQLYGLFEARRQPGHPGSPR